MESTPRHRMTSNFALVALIASLALALQGCGDSKPTGTTTTTTVPSNYGYDGQPKFMLDEVGMKAFSYNPLFLANPECIKHPGVGGCTKIINDDVSAEWGELMWGPEGRHDIATIKAFGANAIRLYGNDQRMSKRKFFDELLKNDMKVLTGLSNWPFVHSPGGCIWEKYECYKTAVETHKAVLDSAEFAKDGYYHNVIEVLNLMNEPDIHAYAPGGKDTKNNYIKALITIFDGVLSAEKEMKIKPWKNNKLPKFTIAWSNAKLYEGTCNKEHYIHDSRECGPAIGFIAQFYWAVHDPEGTVGYTPVNDLKKAFKERWVNSIQPFNPSKEVYRTAILPAQTLPSMRDQKMYLGEFNPAVDHCGDHPICKQYGKKELERDIKDILTNSNWTKSVWGLSFFQFQQPYNKVGNHELQYGMFKMIPDAPWTTGYILGDEKKNHPINCLVFKTRELGEAVAASYGGTVPTPTCPSTTTTTTSDEKIVV
eukprot:TRINITY_DN67137_c0_g1_i1.p1 TRINITY_DN67137_c0_g1~~TRINITY_DN67137_c0_g1_i1.p1  ORF type:complete len:482 (-),score=80.14 TRINITY_DN67137_c0_g1_i1:116-1561(-)